MQIHDDAVFHVQLIFLVMSNRIKIESWCCCCARVKFNLFGMGITLYKQIYYLSTMLKMALRYFVFVTIGHLVYIVGSLFLYKKKMFAEIYCTTEVCNLGIFWKYVYKIKYLQKLKVYRNKLWYTWKDDYKIIMWDTYSVKQEAKGWFK